MINLFLIDYFNRSCNGLSTYTHQLSNYLCENNQICLNLIWVKSNGYAAIGKEIDKKNVTHYYLPGELSVLSDGSSFDFLVAEYFAKETTSLENIIFHFNWINHCPFAHLLKSKINCKTILTKHCIPWRDLITNNYNTFSQLNRKLISSVELKEPLHDSLINEQLAYSSLDHIICVTEFARTALKKFFKYPDRKISVIYNGLDNSKQKRSNSIIKKEQYGFSPNEKIILYAGAVNRRKGIYDLVAVFNKMSEKDHSLRLVIAGAGEHAKLLETTRKWSKITLTGNLDKKTLADFFDMADVGVVPSYVEQCSYIAIEMMSHGVPLVVANVDGLTEIVPDDCGLKADLVRGPKSVKIKYSDLEAHLSYFLNHREKANEYSIRAKKHALKAFNGKQMALATASVYSIVANQNDKGMVVSKTLGTQPLVSIILPCYNGERFLRECIDSILAQTYNSFELMVVDDGSTDNTLNILRKVDDKRVRILRNVKNEGIVSCLNKGINAAMGKYIARIDADDYMHRERLEKQVLYLEDEKNRNVAVVGSHHYIINSMGKLVGLKQYPMENDEIKIKSFFQNPFSHPSVMMRADVVKELKYLKKFKHTEDYDLWFRIFEKHKSANIPEFLTYYRIHDKNISGLNARIQAENAVDLISYELDKLGIDYTVEEIALHISIYRGLGTTYFNTPEKRSRLDAWLDKILEATGSKFSYDIDFVKKMKRNILKEYCGIEEL